MLEVGLGGRLDATNIVDADVGVVCSIGLDHVDWLGDSLEQIGREKAGIFRPGRPAVLGLATHARARCAKVIEELGARPVAPDQRLSRARARSAAGTSSAATCACANLPLPALAGGHQIGNAATALAAIAVWRFRYQARPCRGQRRVVRACASPGASNVVPGEVEWILDVAHNVPAAETLRDNLRHLPRARRTLAICGILGDKDIRGITARLAADVDAWILAALEGPRAVGTQQIAAALPPDAAVIAQASDVAEPAGWRARRARPGDRVLVFGSFLTVGPALEFLGI